MKPEHRKTLSDFADHCAAQLTRLNSVRDDVAFSTAIGVNVLVESMRHYQECKDALRAAVKLYDEVIQ